MDLGNRAATDLGVPAEQIGRPRAGWALHFQRGRAVGEMKGVLGGVNTAGIAQETSTVESVLEDRHGQQIVHVSVAGSGDSSVVQA